MTDGAKSHPLCGARSERPLAVWFMPDVVLVHKSQVELAQVELSVGTAVEAREDVPSTTGIVRVCAGRWHLTAKVDSEAGWTQAC